MLKSIEEVYYIIDEIVQHVIQNTSKKGRRSKLTMSEIITILIEGHRRHYLSEKQLYILAIGELKPCFNNIPCYVQFTRAIRKTMPYLDLILEVFTQLNADKVQKFCIVDSTSLPVAGYNKKDVKWALGSAGTSKNMHGFYQGFKLHIIINQNREIISVATTQANVHDIQLLKDHKFIEHVKGILLGDKGYIASEAHQKMLRKKGVKLIAKQRENMDPYLNKYYKPLLKKRRCIECIFGYLKTRVGLIFPFLRTAESFIVHVKAAVLTYIMRKFDSEKSYV
jgi:hypothetical protein